MTTWFARLLAVPARSHSAVVVLFLVMWAIPHSASGEWYVAGYGGASIPFALNTVQFNQLGETLNENIFRGGKNNPPVDGTYSQQLHSSDLQLKRSPLFGGRVGYFFADEGFKWLGTEFEVYTTTPTIKNQTVSTLHTITYSPFRPQNPPVCIVGSDCAFNGSIPGTQTIPESSMRLVTFAFNVVVRYPGKVFQPYAGVGGGAFYFSSSGAVRGHQVVPGLNAFGGVKVLILDDVGLFVEGKFNRATITNLDSAFGLSGEYNAFNVLAGLAYHF